MIKVRLFKKIGVKLALFSACGIVAVGAFSVAYITGSYQRVIQEINVEHSEKALVTLNVSVENFKADSKKVAESLAGNDAVINAVESGSSVSVRAAAKRAVDEMGLDVDFITVTDSKGTVLARTHSEKDGDSVLNQKNVSQALAGATTTHTETGSEIPLSIRTGAPVKNAAGQIVGVISTGYSLVNTDFVDKLKDMTGNDFTIFIGDERANTTIIKDGERVVGTKLDSKIAATVLEDLKNYTGQADILGAPYATAYAPILDVDGNAVGVLFAGVPLSEIAAMSQRTIVASAVIELLLVLLVIACLVIFVRRKISRPLAAISEAAEELSRGNLNLQIKYKSDDELGILADAFRTTIASLQSYIRDISDKLGQMAQGDMRVNTEMDYAGDFSEIRRSIENIAGALNRTLSMIDVAAGQVSDGASQVASGAQALAAGSAEQAAAVEELSASITVIAEQAEENSANVKTAAEYVELAGEGMRSGNEHMRHLAEAMADIGAASNQIAGITKVIEDIAFQTNILALNAAVEAARAGSSGKGFAVVADEVRNLAAKSAEAARQTTELLQRSVDSVSRGTEIADQTAHVLQDVGVKAAHVTESIVKVERASMEQTGAIEQIKQGLNQVSSVIQANAATAEENSATSEEMSAQAATLNEEVGKFKLDSVTETASH